MSVLSPRRVAVAVAGVAALATGVPAHATTTTKEVCTGDVGLRPVAWVNYCQDVQFSDDTAIVSTAAGLYVCTAVTGCVPIPIDRTGAGVNGSRQVCFVIDGNGGRGWTCV
jgi:hypothetical protein